MNLTSILESLTHRRFVHVHSLTETNFRSICSNFGPLVPSVPKGPLIDRLFFPWKKLNSGWLSAMSHGTISWHTDCPYYLLPPRFVALYCIDDGVEDVKTELSDPLAILTPAISNYLKSFLWLTRCNGVLGKQITIITNLNCKIEFIRYQPNAMRPLGRHLDSSKIESLMSAANESIIFSENLRPGDALFWDNWLLMHRRYVKHKTDSSTLDYEKITRRQILRALIKDLQYMEHKS